MFLIIMMALALSLDAFSVALIIGFLDNNLKKHLLFSALVGAFHFFMPLFGAITNNLLLKNILINGNKFLGVILIIIAISMVLDSNKETKSINTTNILFLSLSVSVDSFFAGIGLNSVDNNLLLSFMTFMLFSFSFSFIGCYLGKTGKNMFGKQSRFIAIIILLLLSVKYILFN